MNSFIKTITLLVYVSFLSISPLLSTAPCSQDLSTSVTSPSVAFGQRHVEPKVVRKEVSISSFYADMLTLMNQYGPENVAIISDVDGTLTNQSVPKPGKVRSRGDSARVMQDFAEKGAFVVFSSAWNKFDETVGRIKALGLSDIAQVNQVEESFVAKLPRARNKKLEVLRQGNIVSCRYPSKGKYYVQKAYALDYVVPRENRTFKVVCILEDSGENLNLATEDMRKTRWYPHVEEVYLFQLSPIYGQRYAEDFVCELNQPNRDLVEEAAVSSNLQP